MFATGPGFKAGEPDSAPSAGPLGRHVKTDPFDDD